MKIKELNPEDSAIVHAFTRASSEYLTCCTSINIQKNRHFSLKKSSRSPQAISIKCLYYTFYKQRKLLEHNQHVWDYNMYLINFICVYFNIFSHDNIINEIPDLLHKKNHEEEFKINHVLDILKYVFQDNKNGLRLRW